MRAPNLRRALQLLPACATTGIGSLPHPQLEPALRAALALDLPCLPQLPVGHPSEFMLPQALEGLPGLSWNEAGLCTVDPSGWAEGREGLEARLETALATGALESFEPSPEACRAWRPFLEAVGRGQRTFAKAQLAGPFTVLSLVRTREGVPLLEVPGMEQIVSRLLRARARAMVKALRRTGTTPLFFLDEPGLYAFSRSHPVHVRVLGELRRMGEALQEEGALWGVHCCANTDWASLLDSGVDLLAMDVRLSLDAVLEESGALARFLESGASLCLGLIPTEGTSPEEVRELVEAVEVSLESALPPGHSVSRVLSQVVLTPACGLAMRSVEDAGRVLEQLQLARRLLLEARETGPVSPRSPFAS